MVSSGNQKDDQNQGYQDRQKHVWPICDQLGMQKRGPLIGLVVLFARRFWLLAIFRGFRGCFLVDLDDRGLNGVFGIGDWWWDTFGFYAPISGISYIVIGSSDFTILLFIFVLA